MCYSNNLNIINKVHNLSSNLLLFNINIKYPPKNINHNPVTSTTRSNNPSPCREPFPTSQLIANPSKFQLAKSNRVRWAAEKRPKIWRGCRSTIREAYCYHHHLPQYLVLGKRDISSVSFPQIIHHRFITYFFMSMNPFFFYCWYFSSPTTPRPPPSGHAAQTFVIVWQKCGKNNSIITLFPLFLLRHWHSQLKRDKWVVKYAATLAKAH